MKRAYEFQQEILATPAMTKEHIEILKHTSSRAAGGMYCGDSSEMQDLVAWGLMVRVGCKSFVKDPYFRMTIKGRNTEIGE